MSIIAFDAASIQSRIVARARALMEADGYIGASLLFTGTDLRLIQAVSEEFAYEALYDEQLSREITWGLAQNRSSIMAQVPFYNYTPYRMIGARGLLRVSSSPTFSGGHALPIPVPRWASFLGGGYTFTCMGDPNNSYADYSLNPTSNFIDIAIIQGIPKLATFEITSAAFTAPGYITLELDLATVENSMLDVRVNGLLWSKISKLRLAQSGDELVYAVRDARDFSKVYLDFGNDVFGHSLRYGDVVTVRYLDTSGPSGDISSSGVITTVNEVYRDSMDTIVPLYCTNLEAIAGGRSYEDIEDIRAAAPLSYKNSGVVITIDNYQSAIRDSGLVDRVMVWGESEENEDRGNAPGTYIPAQENVVHITGFNVEQATGRGIVITEAEKALIRNLLAPQKGTTDILQFQDTQFVYLWFTTTLYISDTKYVPSAVQADVYNALRSEYGLARATYYTDLYASKYKAFIDGQPGVDHHVTSVQVLNLARFTSAYEFVLNFNMLGIVPTSVGIYIKGGEFADWVQLAHDEQVSSTVGNIVGNEIPGQPGVYFQIPAATVQYTNGVIGTLVVTSGLAADFSLYQIRALFRLVPATGVDVDLLLTKRHQIIGFYEATITPVQMT